jgi:hypothetical protein
VSQLTWTAVGRVVWLSVSQFARVLTCSSAEQTGPIIITSVVAFTITGGAGVLRRLGEWQLSSTDNNDEDDVNGPRFLQGPLANDEIQTSGLQYLVVSRALELLCAIVLPEHKRAYSDDGALSKGLQRGLTLP